MRKTLVLASIMLLVLGSLAIVAEAKIPGKTAEEHVTYADLVARAEMNSASELARIRATQWTRGERTRIYSTMSSVHVIQGESRKIRGAGMATSMSSHDVINAPSIDEVPANVHMSYSDLVAQTARGSIATRDRYRAFQNAQRSRLITNADRWR